MNIHNHFFTYKLQTSKSKNPCLKMRIMESSYILRDMVEAKVERLYFKEILAYPID